MAESIQYLRLVCPFTGLHIPLYCHAMKLLLSLVLAGLISLSPALVGSQTATSQDQDDVIRVRSNEVRLDVVVKDKKGRPIRDLKATDFEVLEDGVTQKVESFRFVTREPAPVTGETKDDKGKSSQPEPVITPPTGPTGSTPAVTALVFDRLSPEARALARKAGLAYAQEGMATGGFTGVFGIDQTLRTVQNFTDNTQLIKDAVERATGTSTSTYASGAAQMRESADRSTALDQQIASSTATAAAAGAAQDSASAAAAGAAAGQAAAAQKLLEMQNQMLDHYERLERDQERGPGVAPHRGSAHQRLGRQAAGQGKEEQRGGVDGSHAEPRVAGRGASLRTRGGPRSTDPPARTPRTGGGRLSCTCRLADVVSHGASP